MVVRVVTGVACGSRGYCTAHLLGYVPLVQRTERVGRTGVAAESEANVQLEGVLSRAGWSRKELARRVNQRARVRGVRLHTDASATCDPASPLIAA